MSDSRMLICGGLLILCGALYFFNAPFIMRKSLRGNALVKAYMKRIGIILAALGLLCIGWSFVGPEPTVWLKIAFAVPVIAGITWWIWSNNKLSRDLRREKETSISKE